MTSSPPRPSEDPSFVCILRFELPAIRHYRRSLGLQSDRSALRGLARALAASDPWQGLPGARFVVRPAPEPVIGIVAGAAGIEPARLLHQARAFENAPGRLHYVGYEEAGAAVKQLAGKLIQSFGLDRVRGFRYTAIPRGGLTVLGLLMAHLDVPAERALAAPAEDDGEPLVVVDDCALSGARFAAFLERCSARQIVFAHLYSHPALREALAAGEPRLLACFAGRDLRDEGPERLGGGWDEARERWRERLGASRVWLGDCERIAFPWNEPDRLVWNPEAREVELGWKLVPPDLCLKRGARQAEEAARPRIQVQPRGAGPWRPTPEVLFACRRGETLVHRLDTGELFRLPGTAHAMWWALVRGGDAAAALHLLLARYHVAEETLAADLARFLGTLEERGLFARAPES